MSQRSRWVPHVAVVAGALFAAAIASGCTSGSERGAGTTTEASVATTMYDPVAMWADAFCSGFDRWLDQLAGAGALGRRPAPSTAASRLQVVDTLDRLDAQTKALVQSVDRLGAPPVDRGPALLADLEARFSDVRTTIRRTRAAVAALDPASPTYAKDLAAHLTTFGQEVAAAGGRFASIDARYPDAALGAALVRSCNF